MRAGMLLNEERLALVADICAASGVPGELESSTHDIHWPHDLDALANAYLAVVAICHQTSPIGERRLEGHVAGSPKVGWDYLKERFLQAAARDKSLTTPDRWKTLSPLALSDLYRDEQAGQTLNRVNERTFLLNDLGSRMASAGLSATRMAFESCGRRLAGQGGFLEHLSRSVAYGDPVRKKSLFFVAIAQRECAWTLADPENLLSPVDYHELRGHLRLGSVMVADDQLRIRILRALPLADDTDTQLRRVVQEANERLARHAGLTSSVVHYLLWNVFRNCCPRDAKATHCYRCPPGCGLPPQYKSMTSYRSRCIFAGSCESAGKSDKLIEPPYVGHFY